VLDEGWRATTPEETTGVWGIAPWLIKSAEQALSNLKFSPKNPQKI